MTNEVLILEMTLIAILICGVVALIWIQRALRELHLSLNSRLDALLDTTRALARSEGFAAGQKNHIEGLKQATSDLK